MSTNAVYMVLCILNFVAMPISKCRVYHTGIGKKTKNGDAAHPRWKPPFHTIGSQHVRNLFTKT